MELKDLKRIVFNTFRGDKKRFGVVQKRYYAYTAHLYGHDDTIKETIFLRYNEKGCNVMHLATKVAMHFGYSDWVTFQKENGAIYWDEYFNCTPKEVRAIGKTLKQL